MVVEEVEAGEIGSSCDGERCRAGVMESPIFLLLSSGGAFGSSGKKRILTCSSSSFPSSNPSYLTLLHFFTSSLFSITRLFLTSSFRVHLPVNSIFFYLPQFPSFLTGLVILFCNSSFIF